MTGLRCEICGNTDVSSATKCNRHRVARYTVVVVDAATRKNRRAYVVYAKDATAAGVDAVLQAGGGGINSPYFVDHVEQTGVVREDPRHKS